MNGYLKTLRVCLDQCNEMIKEIHDPIGWQIVEDHKRLLESDIARLENFEKSHANFVKTTGSEE